MIHVCSWGKKKQEQWTIKHTFSFLNSAKKIPEMSLFDILILFYLIVPTNVANIGNKMKLFMRSIDF